MPLQRSCPALGRGTTTWDEEHCEESRGKATTGHRRRGTSIHAGIPLPAGGVLRHMVSLRTAAKCQRGWSGLAGLWCMTPDRDWCVGLRDCAWVVYTIAQLCRISKQRVRVQHFVFPILAAVIGPAFCAFLPCELMVGRTTSNNTT